ncbi:YdbL family protein [Psychromonas antarctica]|uniref:YdbL family protein n=1 Tax=Psychromonas antarctica TaxID=67573 RepID=UPI001EE8E5EE|nr:YdbL family protein [Psychromonas antarctica]MCG6201010.1 YdbL family protein [Psychromonas antarctica]
MKKIFLIFTLMLSFSAFALDLSDAKDQGVVGEQTNGLLGVVEASPAVAELVKDINSKRLVQYKQIAEKNGMTLEQVSILAGAKTIQKTPAGQYIQNAAGQWVVK